MNSSSLQLVVHADFSGNIKAFSTTGSLTASGTMSGNSIKTTGYPGGSRVFLPGSQGMRMIEFSSLASYTALTAYALSTGSPDSSHSIVMDSTSNIVWMSKATATSSTYPILRYDYELLQRGTTYSYSTMQFYSIFKMSAALYAMGT